MLVELIKGKTVDEAKNLVNIFFAMLKSNASEEQIDMLNEAQILSILKEICHQELNVQLYLAFIRLHIKVLKLGEKNG